MFEYFDIHSHIYFPDFDNDRESVIAEMKEKKIGTITIGTGFESSQKAIQLAQENENMFACVGDHPGDLTVDSVFDQRLIELAQDEKVVSIGECGLDYFRLAKPSVEADGRPTPQGAEFREGEVEKIKKVQENIFESHIDLSLQTDKPLMLHVRPSDKINFDAYKDTLNILENRSKIAGDKLKGNVHFFVGNIDLLKRFLSIGFTVSFGGVITFVNEYNECIKYAPLDMIMSETDAPLIAPVPYRGKRGSPLHIPEVVKKIAEIRGEDFEIVKKTLVQNAIKYFKLV